MNKIIKNYIYNVSYNLLNLILPLITAPYLARILGAEGVGIYVYYFTIAQYFSLFAKLGLTHYGTRHIAEVRDDQKKLKSSFSNVYAMQILAVFSVSILYYIYVFFVAERFALAAIFGIWILFIAFDTDWFLFGLEDFKSATIRNFIVKIVSTLSIFLFVHTVSDIWIYAAITSLSYAIGYFCLWIKCRRYLDIHEINIKTVISHIKPCLILLVSVIALNIYRSMDKVMLGALSGMTETGLYDYAEKLIYCLTTMIASLGSVMLPKMSNLAVKNDFEKSRRYIRTSMLFIMFFTNGMAFGLMAVSNNLIPILYGPEFYGSVKLLNLLAITLVAIGWGNVIRSQYLIPQKKDMVYVWTISAGAVINLFVNYFMIPVYGAVGACIGTLCAEFAVPILQALSIRGNLPYKKLILQSIPFPIFGGIMYFILKKIEENGYSGFVFLVVEVLFGIFIYGVLSSMYIYFLKKRNFNLSKISQK